MNARPVAFATVLAGIAVLSACATEPEPAGQSGSATAAVAATAAALDQILAADHRSAEHKARDAYRHPKETLLFFGVRPDMHVVEIWPGANGWYTEILAPLLREEGKLYTAQWDPDATSEYIQRGLAAFRARLGARPDLYDRVEVTVLAASPDRQAIAPPGSVDLVVTFRNLHNWMTYGWAPEALAAMYAALKPGGVLGVVEHRGNPAVPQDPKATSGYVNEDYAIKLIESAGFRHVGASEINANRLDTKDYERGVWTLPPSFRLGEADHSRYADIGESDRFTLKFVKPR